MKLGLFGNPVKRSLSARIFALLDKSVVYEKVLVEGSFPAAVAKARRAGWAGANVTIPFKSEAYALAERLTPAARAVGAVNVLKFGERLVGHNTDAEGLRDAFKHHNLRLKGKSVLILGAGGAARAAGWACGKDGARSVRFANRTPATAARCARELGRLFPRTAFSAGAPADADVWINATPSALAPKGLRPPLAAIDLVYGRATAFQRAADRLDARVCDGAAMLVHQALRAYEFWSKPLAGRAALARRIIQEIS